MPTLTPADALIRAADNLTSAIAGIVPLPNMTTDTINQFMHIFKQQAKTAKNNATVQRMLKEHITNPNMADIKQNDQTEKTDLSVAN